MFVYFLIIISTEIFAQLNPESDYILQNYFAIQKNLTGRLFANYDRSTPAIYLSTGNDLPHHPMQVNVTLSYCRLLSVEEAQQSIVMIAELYITWTDPRLTWNPSDYHGLKTITVARKDTIWLPDVLLYDVITSDEVLDENKQTVTITSDGMIGMFSTLVQEFICLLELTHFPFDTQYCNYRLSSFSYSQEEMQVTGILFMNTSDLKTAGNRAWSVLDVWLSNTEYYYAPTQQTFSNPQFTFVLKRSTQYYILQLIIPSFIVTLLCMLGLFWEPVDSDSYMDKLNLGFAAILAMMFVMQTGTEAMPKINEIDRLYSLGLITIACGVIMLFGKTPKCQVKKCSSDSRFNMIKKFFLRNIHLVLLAVFSLLAIIDFTLLVA